MDRKKERRARAKIKKAISAAERRVSLKIVDRMKELTKDQEFMKDLNDELAQLTPEQLKAYITEEYKFYLEWKKQNGSGTHGKKQSSITEET